jgi:hypothetical protein
MDENKPLAGGVCNGKQMAEKNYRIPQYVRIRSNATLGLLQWSILGVLLLAKC